MYVYNTEKKSVYMQCGSYYYNRLSIPITPRPFFIKTVIYSYVNVDHRYAIKWNLKNVQKQ